MSSRQIFVTQRLQRFENLLKIGGNKEVVHDWRKRLKDGDSNVETQQGGDCIAVIGYII